jgi:diaminopimelate epimerase
MKRDVSYMSGAGNLFTVLDADELEPRQVAQNIERLCDARSAIGRRTEGVLLVATGGDRLRVSYFNPDGSSGMMCGNGARCAVRYALDRGSIVPSDALTIALADTQYTARIVGDTIAIEFPPPRTIERNITLDVGGCTLCGDYLDVGSDHVVFASDRLADTLAACGRTLDFLWLAPRIRFHERFPRGTNVNMYRWEGATIALVTYERGVEAITGACGTGALATAVAAWLRGETNGTTIGIVPPSGERLDVEIVAEGGAIARLILAGPAREIGRATVELTETA